MLNNFGYKDFGLYLLDRLHNLLETTNIFEECDEGTIQSFVPGTAIVSMGMKETKSTWQRICTSLCCLRRQGLPEQPRSHGT